MIKVPPLSEVESLLAQAHSEFLRLSEGKTICQIGREQNLNHELKQAEGALQALQDVARCIRKNQNDEKLEQCVKKILIQWQQLSEISAEWVAYKQAGLKQIASILK